MKQILIIAGKEFGDRFRSGWVIVCAAVWLGAIVLTSFFGLIQIGQIGMQGYERTVASLLNLSQYLVPLLALLLGQDLMVGEREDRTLALLLASGVTRQRLLLGKFLGGCLTLGLPLVTGFAVAGIAIGIAARDSSVMPFLKLASSGLVLGLVFLGIGLLISTQCRTRVQTLVAAVLTWGLAVFVFDLVALGLLVTTQSPTAAKEIEFTCEATHVNPSADIHQEFEAPAGGSVPRTTGKPEAFANWLLLNPVDLFRTINLPAPLAPLISGGRIISITGLWLIGVIGLAAWQFRRLDV